MSKYLYKYLTPKSITNFHKKYTIQPNGCWQWHGCIQNGYSRFNLPNKKGCAVGHRIAWMIEHEQDWPTELESRHTCNNGHCVNPHHILPGTAKENRADFPKELNDRIIEALTKSTEKAIQTPYGRYDSKAKAVRAIFPDVNEHTAQCRMTKLLKTPNSGYYFL